MYQFDFRDDTQQVCTSAVKRKIDYCLIKDCSNVFAWFVHFHYRRITESFIGNCLHKCCV